MEVLSSALIFIAIYESGTRARGQWHYLKSYVKQNQVLISIHQTVRPELLEGCLVRQAHHERYGVFLMAFIVIFGML